MNNDRLAHLAIANEVRVTNAATLREIRKLSRQEAADRVCQILAYPDDYTSRLKIGALLKAMHGIGERKATQLCLLAGIPGGPNRRIAPSEGKRRLPALCLSQRERLIGLIQEWA